jgi:parvulin-like peptidyl-prolyl isomerase
MKYYFLIVVLIPLLNFSQTALEKQLDTIVTSEDAVKFLKANRPEDGKLITFNKEKHKTTLASSLFKYREGGKKIIRTGFKRTVYKILDKSMVDFYRFDIILLDGNKTSNQQAKVIRNKVLSQYNEGFKFKDLAKHHSDGPTAKTGGDTGWIKPGDMSSEAFDDAAFNQIRAIDEVFTVDDEINKKYYLVMKTRDKTPIEEITVLKFTEDLD